MQCEISLWKRSLNYSAKNFTTKSSKFPEYGGKHPSGSASSTASPSQDCNQKHRKMAPFQQRLLGPEAAIEDATANCSRFTQGTARRGGGSCCHAGLRWPGRSSAPG